jgi:hypothetical protein
MASIPPSRFARQFGRGALIRGTGALLVVLLLSGCTVGPQERLPRPEGPAKQAYLAARVSADAFEPGARLVYISGTESPESRCPIPPDKRPGCFWTEFGGTLLAKDDSRAGDGKSALWMFAFRGARGLSKVAVDGAGSVLGAEWDECPEANYWWCRHEWDLAALWTVDSDEAARRAAAGSMVYGELVGSASALAFQYLSVDDRRGLGWVLNIEDERSCALVWVNATGSSSPQGHDCETGLAFETQSMSLNRSEPLRKPATQ